MSSKILGLYAEIENLATAIESKWLKYNYSSDDFYKVVWDLTEKTDLTPLGEISNQLELLENTAVRFQQHRSTFSDFHFQIFHNGRFLVEILNWWGAHVNVHDHDFSGVQFQVKGNALNVIYDFTPTETQGALRFGSLAVRKAEIWKEGGRSIVRHGALDPHSVLHLSAPTTSLLIRTIPTPRYGAQSNYFPTLAAHYYVNNDIQRKKLTGLGLLASSSPDEFSRYLTKFLGTQSLSENFFMLLKLGQIVFTDTYAHLARDYAKRGENEARIVQSVAYHNAIEFFKTKGNTVSKDSEAEKLALFAAAASFERNNFQKIENHLKAAGVELETKKHFDSFLKKLDSRSAAQGRRYLDLFGLAWNE